MMVLVRSCGLLTARLSVDVELYQAAQPYGSGPKPSLCHRAMHLARDAKG